MKTPLFQRIKGIVAAGLFAVAAGVLAGCASAGALQNAKASFEKAKAAGAEQKAAYEYYAAEAYLDLAQHEADEGDGSQARAYAAESGKFSARAIEKAGGGAK